MLLAPLPTLTLTRTLTLTLTLTRTRFPQRCGELVNEWARRLQLPTRSALDIGCAVGGASFELAKTYDRVVGVDRSEAFVSAAKSMGLEGRRRFWMRDQGTLGDLTKP